MSWIILKLHYRGCKILLCVCRPFQYCKSRLGVKWDPFSSIIQTFSTYILLVYTKIIVVSYDLLAPSRVYNQSGELPYKILSYDSSIHFLDQHHLPLFIFALCMLAIFCVLPTLILLLYPIERFQKLLNQIAPFSIREALRTFTEAYMGCYKDRTDGLECRYFASFYFLFRVVYLTCLFFVEYSYVWFALIITPWFISLLFAMVQPYKKKWLNIVDSVTFTFIALATLLLVYDIHISRIPLWILQSLLSLPLFYFVGLFIIKLKFWYIKCRAHREATRQENLQQESETECSPLIN